MNNLFKLAPIAAVLMLAACGGQGEKSASGATGSSNTSASTDCGKLAENEICVKIGSAAPKTGGIAHLGKDNENGVALAIQDINAKGDLTIDGKKVKLVMDGEDDAGDPKQGPIVAQKLVDAGVVGVVGHLNSGVSIPASTVYANAGMVEVSPSSTNPDYTLKSSKTPDGHVSAYRVVATDAKQGPALAQYIVKNGGKKVALLDDATQYGKGLADQVEKALKGSSVTIVSRDAATDKTTDFKAVLTEIKAKNPDFIFWGGMDDTAATLVKQMKELGITAKLVSDDGACSDKFIQLAGNDGEGMICSQAGMPLAQMPKGADFSAAYEKAFPGQKVQIYSPFAYDATYAIVEAMKIANSVDREAIAAAMPKVSFDGLTGRVEFDQNGDIKQGAISLFEVKDKKLNVVEVVK
ncbi:branched-chain amino acid ABC transporter substrate-binding protein [Snodgrassella sp. CFCC 13594]|uniref:branched-chain amino acid ABC transporter substrate-binding protein n=1 Tax=Snodgrassella sp. CFCC 13594 TaxID=1775559 RepID=UPI000AE23CB8|nr:branched-chain amino acid ABC transporter substrate-binding protein [Snodgrassella sp. CFCC 13594]